MQDVVIFGYSRKDLTDEDLRSIIASTLTCRIDHQYVSFINLRVFCVHSSASNFYFFSNINFVKRCARMVKMCNYFFQFEVDPLSFERPFQSF
jgi:glucose-6-phosphate 1-dehydrogenase